MGFKTYSITKKWINPYTQYFSVKNLSDEDGTLNITTNYANAEGYISRDANNVKYLNYIYSFDQENWVYNGVDGKYIDGANAYRVKPLTVPAHKTVYLRAAWKGTYFSDYDNGHYVKFKFNKIYEIAGNIDSLFDGNALSAPSSSVVYYDTQRRFRGKSGYTFFQNETNMTSAENSVITFPSARYLFSGCTNLVYAPFYVECTEVDSFRNCSSLVREPKTFKILHTNYSNVGYIYGDCTSLSGTVHLAWDGGNSSCMMHSPLENVSKVDTVILPKAGWNKTIYQLGADSNSHITIYANDSGISNFQSTCKERLGNSANWTYIPYSQYTGS